MSRKKADPATEEASPVTEQDEATNGQVLIPQLILIDQVDPNPFNPRHTVDEEALKELVHSMQQHGFLGVLDGRPVDGRMQLAYGARRLAAARQARLSSLRVIVHSDWDDRKMQEVALVENLQRQDLSPVEEAEALAALIEQHGYTHAQAGKVIGKSQGYVTQKLAYRHLHAEAREALAGGEITATHARDLVAIPTLHQPTVLKAIEGLSTRKAQNLIQAVATALSDPEWWTIPDEQRDQLDYIEAHLAELLPWHYHRLKDPVAWLLSQRDRGQLKPLRELVHLARQDYEARNLLGRSVAEAWKVFVHDQHPEWTCETCAFKGRRNLAGKVQTNYRDLCTEKADSCLLYTDGGPAMIPLPYWDFQAIAAAHKDDPRVRRTEYGFYALGVDVLEELQQERKVAQERDTTQVKRGKAEQTQGTVAAYQELLAIAAVDHPLAQPCRLCVHHKVEAAEPGKSCEYGVVGLDRYEELEIHAWKRDDGRLVPRCSRFDYKEIDAVPETACPAEVEVLVRLMAEEVLAGYSQHYSNHHPAVYLVKLIGGSKELIRRIPLPKLVTLVYEQLLRARINQYAYHREDQDKGKMVDPTDGRLHEWQRAKFPELEIETVRPADASGVAAMESE